MAKQREGKLRATKIEVNTFTKGMRKDLSKTIQAKDSYVDAQNVRLTTDLGSSIGALVNIKGNDLSVTLPSTSAVYEIKKGNNIPPPGTVLWLQINLTNQGTFTSPSFTITKTGEEALEEMMIKFVEAANTISATGIRAKRVSKLKVIVWCVGDTLVDNTGIGIIAGGFYSAPMLLPIYSSFDVLGAAYIREQKDYTVLFTTSVPAVSNGQIWKISYNEQTQVPTIELLYNNKLNFSTDSPIEATGIYETELIQRVYWTDRGRNAPRVINIADPDVMGTAVKTIDLSPQADINKLTLKSIQPGGKLKSGIYQYAYRLRSPGCVTRFSPLSNQIHVVDRNELEAEYWFYNAAVKTLDKQYLEYTGTEGVASGKSITLSIRDIDGDYDIIEIAAFYKEDATSAATLELIEEKEINAEVVIDFTHTGNELAIPLSTQQLSAFGIPFDSVQTFAVKDSRLIAANTKGKGYLDTKFNARAYRYKSDGSTYVSNANVDPFDSLALQSDKDAINPFNLYDDDPAFEEYKFQSDGATMGGEGPNVSYRFIKEQLEGDKYNKADSTAGTQPTSAPLVDKVREVDTSFSMGIPNQNYQTLGTWRDYKNPAIDGMFKGYTRGEIYRFGLVFYDKKGTPGYVNWIGDIRFPEMYEEEPDPAYNGGIETYTLGHTWSSNYGSDNHKLYALGIEFTVDVTSVKDDISGYSIVRVKRTDADKTRLGTGIVTKTVNASATGDPQFFNNGLSSFEVTCMPLHTEMYDTAAPDLPYLDDTITFDCPDFQFGMKGPTKHEEGDKLRIVGLLQGGFSNLLDTTGSGLGSDCIENVKYYDQNRAQRFPDINGETVKLIYDIDFTTMLKDRQGGTGVNARHPDVSGLYNPQDSLSGTPRTYSNNDAWYSGAAGYIYGSGFGLRTNLIHLNENIEWSKFWDSTVVPGSAAWTATTRKRWKLLASYERPLKDQYGGNTEAIRSNNEYISCGNFVPISQTAIDTFKVFGGDTYVSFYGMIKTRPYWPDSWPVSVGEIVSEETDWDEGDGLWKQSELGTYGVGYVFATECQSNIDLRKGCHLLNRNSDKWYIPYLFPEYSEENPGLFEETWEVDDVYSLEDDAITYLGRPIFTDESNTYDTRIYASNPKVNGETDDSWREFTVLTNMELDGTYGPIRKLAKLQDTIYALQDTAIAKISINPTAVVQSETDVALQLGRGGILDDYRYISTEYGTKHQWSVIETDSGIYYFDVIHGKAILFNGKGIGSLSDTGGMSAYFANQWKHLLLTNDNPIEKKGICGTYDTRFGEVIWTFRDKEASGDTFIDHDVTIAYSEAAKAFSSFYSFTPTIYINDGKRILTPDDRNSNNLYLHNEGDYGKFYGTVAPTSVKIVCNNSPVQTKAFDNISWHSEVIDETGTNPVNILKETINSVRFYNDYQNSDYITLATSNLKREEREWQMQVARDAVVQTGADPDIFNPANLLPAQKFKKRIRSKYMLTDLKFDNTLNRRLILHYIKTFFRISIR